MKILITAGPTREAIDPVRYISNRSSGKMGYAIAEAALAKGHEVILVSGPVVLGAPEEAQCLPVESAREMYSTVEKQLNGCHAAIYCAAVSDYRIKDIATQKIKKSEEGMMLHLEKTEDILGSCRSKFNYQGVLVGFAAETENLEANARAKMEKKGCDLLVANDVSRKDIGFDSDQNEVTLFFKDGTSQKIPIQKKRLLATKIIEIVESMI